MSFSLSSAASSSSTPSSPDPDGERHRVRTVGNYQILEVCGRGANGVVYKAVNITSGAMVAVKTMKRGSRVAEGAFEAFLREIELMRSLPQHPNVVRVVDSVSDGDSVSLVMDYVDGGALSRVIQKAGRLPESLIALYCSQVLAGLQFLHESHIIHRDVKGANILVDRDGCAKLVDFGSAAEVCSDLSKRLTVVGSPYWLAPEVIQMSGTSTQSDIWSFGATVIELCSGQPPYWGKPPVSAMFHIVQDAEPPIPEGISEELASLLRICFRKNAKDRPPAAELRRHPFFAKHGCTASGHQQRKSVSYADLLGELEQHASTAEATDVSNGGSSSPAEATAMATAAMNPQDAAQKITQLRHKLHKYRTRHKRDKGIIIDLRAQLAKQRAELEDRNKPDKALRDFFNLLVMAIKTQAFQEHRACEVNSMALYQQAIKERVPWSSWHVWLPKRIAESNSSTSSASAPMSSPTQSRRK